MYGRLLVFILLRADSFNLCIDMNIVIFIHSLRRGGAERTVVNLANEWLKCGNQVTVITLEDKSTDFYQMNAGITHVSLNLAGESSNVFKAIFTNVNRILKLRGMFRRIKPDIVLGMMTISAALAILAGVRLGIPIIGSERVYPPMFLLNRFWHKIRQWTYPYAALVVMQTHKGLTWLQDEIPRANGAVIPNPVPYPLSVFEPKLAPQTLLANGRKLLLGVGRLVDQKRFDCCLLSFATLAKRYADWDLVILGEGPLRGALESQIEALGLESRVYLPGGVGNVGDWYARADLYVMSSSFEGFPNTLVEAMAHGCTAVSYDCNTGPRDIIRDGEDGMLVNPVGDVAALTSALDQLMGDDERRERMAQKAIDVRERFSVESVLAMWDDVFSKVITR